MSQIGSGVAPLKPYKMHKSNHVISICFIKDLWCPETELNRRHEDFQSSALPTELSGPYFMLSSVLVALMGGQEEDRIKPVLVFAVNNKLMKTSYFPY